MIYIFLQEKVESSNPLFSQGRFQSKRIGPLTNNIIHKSPEQVAAHLLILFDKLAMVISMLCCSTLVRSPKPQVLEYLRVWEVGRSSRISLSDRLVLPLP